MPGGTSLTRWLKTRVRRMRDIIVRGGTIISAEGRNRADMAIEDGRIAEIAPEIPGDARLEAIDARRCFLMPGVIDVHLHFNEPGRTEWEGAATGSAALAAGGGTLFFDMPLNSTPCTVNVREFDRKRVALEASSIADFGLWGGLVPGSVRDMADMAARGVVGFKAFMCDSGLPEFPRADDKTLFDGMQEAARLGLPVAVHAESEEMTLALTQRTTGRTACEFLESRPVAAETEAIRHALELAGETGVKLHIVHVSCGSGVAMAADARARGVDVSIETCPHYLFFTADDLESLGVIAKCAPPLRDAHEQGKLWSELLSGRVDVVASDHSPTDPSLKKDGDFRASWGGIAGVQSTLAVLLERGHDGRRVRFEHIVSLLAARPAERFRIRGKGSLLVGNDADLLLLDPAGFFTLEPARLHQRHKSSPYVGASFTGTVRRTIRRGETIFADGNIVAATNGKFVCPT
jgi:allantoinase